MKINQKFICIKNMFIPSKDTNKISFYTNLFILRILQSLIDLFAFFRYFYAQGLRICAVYKSV